MPFKILINKSREVVVEQFNEISCSWTTESFTLTSITEIEEVIHKHFNSNEDEFQELMDAESIIEFNTKILAAKHYQEVHNFIIKNIKKNWF